MIIDDANINGSNDLISLHNQEMQNAIIAARAQQNFADKAKIQVQKGNKLLQVKLFQDAQDYAREVGKYELKAKQYSHIIKDMTQKAQVKRHLLLQVLCNYLCIKGNQLS